MATKKPAPFERSKKDAEKSRFKEGTKREESMDKKQAKRK